MPIAVRRLRALVADDNKDAALTLADVLGMLDWDVEIAHDGEQALQVAGRYQPDLAILDIGMPVMDGYEAAARLRRVAPGVMLVACTGWGSERDKQRTLAAGFHHHLTKPVELPDLQRILEECAARANATPRPIAVHSLVQADSGPVMRVNAVGDGWAYCIWFDDRLEVQHASFPLEKLVDVGRERREPGSWARQQQADFRDSGSPFPGS